MFLLTQAKRALAYQNNQVIAIEDLPRQPLDTVKIQQNCHIGHQYKPVSS